MLVPKPLAICREHSVAQLTVTSRPNGLSHVQYLNSKESQNRLLVKWLSSAKERQASQSGTQVGVRAVAVSAILLQLELVSGLSPSTAYGQSIYTDSVRSSQYVTVRDGTRLAIDIYRPVSGGRPVETKLPVVLVATPYHRSSENNGEILTFLAPQGNHRNVFADILRHGYVVASLDIRGRGASFGTVYAGGMENEANRWDLYDVIEWLAAQPWSDGKIGMGGCSYVGKTQFWAASAAPPHLKAIAPTGAPFDTLAFGSAEINGIRRDLYAKYDQTMQQLDVTFPAAPVDEDHNGSLRQAAIAEHRRSWDLDVAGVTPARKARPFRDTPWPRSEFSYPLSNEWNYLPNYRFSRIPVLQYTGWRDLAIDSVFDWYHGLAGEHATQKLIIGPWYHCEWDQSELIDSVAQYVAWYDYWLKGVDNSVADGPGIRYYVVGAPRGQEWQSANQWPLPNERPKTYYLANNSAGSGESLSTHKPGSSGGKDDYVVDYTTSVADLPTRFFWGIPDTPNPGLVPLKTTALDAKSMTYTTAPLAHDAELTGYPRVHLFASSTAKDLDFFLYLEDVDESGASTLITEGALRSSNRTTRTPPFDNGGIPWHPSYKEDQAELTPGVPVSLEFALHPTSNYIRKGHRIRITINNFDKGAGWDTPEISPAPTVSILHDALHPSSITLPFISRAFGPTATRAHSSDSSRNRRERLSQR